MLVCLVVIVAMFGNALGGIKEDYEGFQNDIIQFNNTILKDMETKMSKHPDLQKVTDLYIRAIYTMYSTILVPSDDTPGRTLMFEFGKWYFQELGEFVGDKIEPRVGNDTDLLETVNECIKEMQLLKIRSTTLFVLYAQEEALEPLMDFSKPDSLIGILGTFLNIPDTVIGIIAGVGMDFVT